MAQYSILNKNEILEILKAYSISEIKTYEILGGGSENTSYRVSANLRDVEGILNNTGFKQLNTRAKQ